MVFYLPENQNEHSNLKGSSPDQVWVPFNTGRRVSSGTVNANGDFASHPSANQLELVTWINTKINEGVINVSATVNVDGVTIDGLGTGGNPYKVATTGIDTLQIADDAVTYAKIQNVSGNDKLLGRETAAAGIVEEIDLGVGLAFNSGALDVTSDGKQLLSGTEYQIWGVSGNVTHNRTGSDITITAATPRDLGRAVLILDSQTIQSNADFNADVTVTISDTSNSVNTWNDTSLTGWDLWIPTVHVFDAGTTTSVAGADLTDESHTGNDATSLEPTVSYGSGDVTLTFDNAAEFGSKSRLIVVLSWLQ